MTRASSEAETALAGCLENAKPIEAHVLPFGGQKADIIIVALAHRVDGIVEGHPFAIATEGEFLPTAIADIGASEFFSG